MTKDEIKELLFELHYSTFRNEKQIKLGLFIGVNGSYRELPRSATALVVNGQ